jgi:predicted nucleic acid-binding protein
VAGGGRESLREGETKDILVSSEILIDFLNGSSGALAALQKAADEGVIRVSAVSAAQVASVAEGERRTAASEMLDSFATVGVDKEVASLAGILFHDRGAGKFELCDCLVAASCRQLGAVLLTRDRSRYPAEGLEVAPAEY